VENIAHSADPILIITASVAENADFDSDGDVDGADLLTWQRNMGITSGATAEQGDANADGAIDGEDLDLRRDQFGNALPAASAVPEPRTIALVVLGAAICSAVTRRKRTRKT
jgi:hypothetical protein